MSTAVRFQIENCRLAFPNLFRTRAVNPGDKPKYGASLIVPKTHPIVAQLNAAFVAVARDKWGDKAEAIMKGMKVQDRLCLHDGDTKAQYQGFAGNLFIGANSDIRPAVLLRDKSPAVESDGKPYSGCYVDASIELWAQDNKHGKRINAQLRGVRFRADGEAFAAGTSASADEFADLADDGDEDVSAMM